MNYNIGMKTGLASVAALAAGSNAAFADSAFTGFYAGLSAGFNSGLVNFTNEYDDTTYTFPQPVLSGFVGANFDTGWNDVIIGAEVAINSGMTLDNPNASPSYIGDYSIHTGYDLKLKAGKEFSGVFAYGFAGISSFGVDIDGSGSYSSTGTNFGIGAEMMISDSISIGVEHVMRQTRHLEQTGDPLEVYNSTLSTTSLRVAFRF